MILLKVNLETRKVNKWMSGQKDFNATRFHLQISVSLTIFYNFVTNLRQFYKFFKKSYTKRSCNNCQEM